MSAVTLPSSTWTPVGVSPTTALRFWRRVSSRLSMLVSRFRVWHAIEPRRDAVASYAALGVGVLATLVALVAL